MTFNLFEIYRNHVRYVEIDKFANELLLSLERKIVTCEANTIGETDSEWLELNNKRIASYYASKRDLLFIMGSSFTYPTQFTFWALTYRDGKFKK